MLMASALSLTLIACGQDEKAGGEAPAGRPSRGNRPPAAEAAIPVKTEAVRRGDMVTYVQTHARLEAERILMTASQERRELQGDLVRLRSSRAKLMAPRQSGSVSSVTGLKPCRTAMTCTVL